MLCFLKYFALYSCFLKPTIIDPILLYFIPPMMALIRFLLFLAKRDGRYPLWLKILGDLLLMVACPVFILFISFTDEQNCCNTDGLNMFAQEHILTMVVWWAIGTGVYLYIQYRKQISTPVVEVLTAWVLLFSVIFNIFISVHQQDFAWAFCVPIIMLLLIALTYQHQKLIPRLMKSAKPEMLDAIAFGEEESLAPKPLDVAPWQERLRSVLDWPVFVKYPLVLVLGIPAFVVVDSILLLFGQRPDSFVLAFTQTYHLHFSKIDYLCEGVQCGGHYLCSVAANGHLGIVRPLRMGVRNGQPIICNRQLLVANAFEEVLQERWPIAHRFVRRHYDRVGDFINGDYSPYRNKYLCDLIYLMMKPADWFFRLVLYTVDRDPEVRIARQYRGTAMNT